MKPDTERRAAEILLERGVRVKVPAPRFLRLLGKKQLSFTVKPPTLRTLIEASGLSLKAGFDLTDIDAGKDGAVPELITKHGETLATIVAVLILNRRKNARLLGRYLTRHLTPQKLAGIVILVVTFSGVQDFTSSIRLIRSLKMTAPRNLSPEDQGSQEDDKADSIAPGD